MEFYDSAILLLGISKRTENRVLKRYVYTHVHSTIIYSSQKVGSNQVSIDGWMGEESV